MAKKQSAADKFLALSDAEKDAEVAHYDREIPLSETRPLNAAERGQWNRFKRKMRGRPVVGTGAKTVAFSIEKGFLKRVDRYAKTHKLKRSTLIVRGLEMVMKAG